MFPLCVAWRDQSRWLPSAWPWPAGCAAAGPPVPPTYTPAELQAQCERAGGWWHPDGLSGGFCEPNSQM